MEKAVKARANEKEWEAVEAEVLIDVDVKSGG